MKKLFHLTPLFALCLAIALFLPSATPAQAQQYGNGGGTWELKPELLQTNRYRKAPTPPNMQDSAVHRCGQTADCVAVNPPCGRHLAVNKDHAKQVQDWYDYVRGSMDCISKPDDSAWSPVCRNRTCTMAPPGPGVPDKSDPGYCRQDTDCRAVTDNCQRVTALNKDHAPQEQARFDALKAAGAQCDWIAKTYTRGVHCENHICKADLSNYPPP
jgi:hypothetical protein